MQGVSTYLSYGVNQLFIIVKSNFIDSVIVNLSDNIINNTRKPTVAKTQISLYFL